MGLHVALLRGVNVVGRTAIAMSDLRDMCESIGLANPRTLLQSGNLVIESDDLTGEALERRLEAETTRHCRISPAYVVRTAAQWKQVVAKNPFRDAAERDPSHFLVTFLKSRPKPAAVEAMRDAIVGPETFAAIGKQLYVIYPDGVGGSKLTHALIERKLGCQATARNWNTVLKLAALLRA